MSRETAALMGSGTLPYTAAILHTSLGGTFAGSLASNAGNGRGIRTGSNVHIGNPEDLVSVPAIRSSGISVGTSAVNILNQVIRDQILKRGRMAIIENLGPGDVSIGGTAGVSVAIGGLEPGYKLLAPTAANVPPQRVELPIMNGCDVWAISSAGGTDIRILLY